MADIEGELRNINSNLGIIGNSLRSMESPFQDLHERGRHDDLMKVHLKSIEESQKLSKSGQDTARFTKWLAYGTILLVFISAGGTFAGIYFAHKQYQALIDHSPQLVVYSDLTPEDELKIVVNNQADNGAINVAVYYQYFFSDFESSKMYGDFTPLLNKGSKEFTFPLKDIDSKLEESLDNQHFYGATFAQFPVRYEIFVTCKNCKEGDVSYSQKSFNYNYGCYKNEGKLECEIW